MIDFGAVGRGRGAELSESLDLAGGLGSGLGPEGATTLFSGSEAMG